LGAQTQVQTDYVHSKDLLTGGALDSVQVDIAHTFPNKLALEVGIHHANETDAPADPSAAGATPINFTSGRIKVTTPLPWVPKAHVFTEYEQDISNAAKQDLTVGGDYQISPVSRIYARHEYISSLTGPDALNTTQTQYSTLVGIDTACMDTAHLFSEYRVQDALDGREAEAAMGLRNQWTLAPGVHVNASYEQLQALSASTANSASTALTGGLDYTRNPLWKGTTRIELRKSSTTDSILHTLGIAYKINRNWTFLGRNLLDITAAEASGAQDALEEHLQFGMAYRPVDRDRWNGLFRYEYIFNKNMDPTITNQDEGDHVISGDLNFQPKRAWTYTVHYAAKITAPNSDTSYAFTQLLSGRVMHDITDRWDAGLLASIMADQWGENRQTGLGAEVGYLIQANLYLSSGYNIFGFSDKYLSDEDYTDQGAYLRLRVKFDEDLFAGHNPQVNTTLPAR
jgi:hypothetical protein